MSGEAAYLTEPAEIYRRSFALIREEADLLRFPGDIEPMVVRIIHACGMTEIAGDIRFDKDVAAAAQAALGAGRAILADCEAVRSAIITRHLPAANPVICTLNNALTSKLANHKGTTRSAAAVDLWADHLDQAVIVIGNAPTALFRLLALMDETEVRPAAILAFPVGFVGAAEAKQALEANSRGVPYMTLLGRRGGSAMAAAALNALLPGGRP